EHRDPHDRQGAQPRPAPGDGGRHQGRAHGRGHRQARRRLPDHRRPAEGLRRGPRRRHPAGRGRHPRHRRGPRHARLPAGVRDPVRRLRLPGLQPDRHPGRQDPRPVPGQGGDAGRHPDPDGRRHRCGRAPQREPGGLLRAHAGPEGRRREQSGRRLLGHPAGHRPPRPDRLPGAQAAVLGEGRGRHRRDAGAAVPLPRAARRRRRHRARLRPHGEDGDAGRGRRRRGGPLAGGHRPAHRLPAGPRPGVRFGPADRSLRRRPRGGRDARHRRRDRRPGDRDLLPLPGGAGAAGGRVRHPLPAVQDRGGLPPRPGPGAGRRRPIDGLL
ncbi:MAG: Branched-chain alpha-keto acid dehydrogenase, E1 component, beta subunit, partial [uncultured Blastococcus sp.]